jgi:quinol monooxygenase YgiN
VIALLQFRPDPAPAADPTQAGHFQAAAEQALRLLAERPGFVRGTVGRATDDPGSWLLLTEWESVGAYRRGLGGYQVKLLATPLLAQALDQPSAFEQLLSIGEDGQEITRRSDRADDAD